MVKATSVKAYDATKQYHATERFRILEDVKHGGWFTAPSLEPRMGKSVHLITPRLRELEYMALVVAKDRGAVGPTGHTVYSYKITDLGMEVVTGGNEGRYVMKALGTHLKNFQDARSAAMKADKLHWETVGKTDLGNAARALVAKHILPW